ncbi:MAG: hypothetical protein H6598_11365, partial [Flavobacteriales bacterium]|nr:hypothetical protein [Flavobacteriales bacterium]
MKKSKNSITSLILFFILTFKPYGMIGQSNVQQSKANSTNSDTKYKEYFERAMVQQFNGEFFKAKKSLDAAKVFCKGNGNKLDTIYKAEDKLFEQINQLYEGGVIDRNRAERAQAISDSLLKIANKARIEADEALNRIYF